MVIHNPDKKKGYYGATVAAPVFKKIAQKMYASAPIKKEVENKRPQIEELVEDSEVYYTLSNEELKTIPDVRGMAGMDAISVLENLGMKVVFEGVGRVRSQSVRKGTRIVKGRTIVLKLS